MTSYLGPYSHIPSSYAIVSGAAFGAARILCAKAVENRFSLVTPVTLPTSYLIIALTIVRGIAGPFCEEYIFRKDLNNPTFSAVIKSSVGFGLIHGLLPGSMEMRITRVCLSTIGGFFYCGARIAGGDLWSSALAHSMYNLRWITELI